MQTNFPRANPSGSRTDQPAQDTSEVHAAAAAIVLAGCGHVAAADEASMSVSLPTRLLMSDRDHVAPTTLPPRVVARMSCFCPTKALSWARRVCK